MISETQCLIQGFGNVGAWAAEIYQEHGAIIRAVSNAFGAIYKEDGLDIKAVRAHIAEGHSLESFPDGAPLATPLKAC